VKTLRVVRPHDRDAVGAEKIWVGHVTMKPGMKSGAHHHGDVESGIYIISGRARFRFGDNLQDEVEVGAGDFVYVPPRAIHQEINADDASPVEAIVVRDGQENVVVNVEME
jgi:uncharacterized RmlC-like cupin family protein